MHTPSHTAQSRACALGVGGAPCSQLFGFSAFLIGPRSCTPEAHQTFCSASRTQSTGTALMCGRTWHFLCRKRVGTASPRGRGRGRLLLCQPTLRGELAASLHTMNCERGTVIWPKSWMGGEQRPYRSANCVTKACVSTAYAVYCTRSKKERFCEQRLFRRRHGSTPHRIPATPRGTRPAPVWSLKQPAKQRTPDKHGEDALLRRSASDIALEARRGKASSWSCSCSMRTLQCVAQDHSLHASASTA